MNPFLFVYGTLMQAAAQAGMGGPQRRRLHGEATFLAAASVSAVLYDFGAHPGATDPPPGATPLLHGEVFELKAPAATFRWLDLYEDIQPGRADNPYVRAERVATLTDARKVPVWIYLYVADTGAARRVPDGRWVAI
jgi:gamma-glutamylcyclotransferase (GGCT)/AIG2-like uncharacterized protein YtfP